VFNVSLNGEPRVVGVAEDGILLSSVMQSKLQHFTVKGVKVCFVFVVLKHHVLFANHYSYL
jgi:hypothetical protein